MLDLIQGALFWIGKIPQDGLLGFLFRLILALIVYAIGTKVIAWLCRIVRKHLLKYGTDEAAKSFVMSILKISLHILLIMTLAAQVGVDRTSIATVLASAGVAVSLALKDGLSNFASGLIIMFLRPFSVGDYIIEHGENNEGTVEKIELYYTTLATTDSRRVVIPNSLLTGNCITNVTAADKRRLEIKVGISYDSNLQKAKDILRELIQEDPELMDQEESQIYVDSLGESSVVLGLKSWVKTEEFWNTKWRMNERIKEAFDANGIQIPYPQLDLRIRDIPKEIKR
ncbi:MAG: mechanosensitive ion channel family protein [Clostridiales bacterium]|uniref:Mechanosensitive ion channel family protein n=1 Tax=Candidatus Pullilachnospira stercoravium TaxID=2840913 RepID=A0A9D1T6C5_9FIRM|nr:mechanosensitive ion channel family protein [Clostridiales bacterium]HIV13227.1 mechanosensitive ion channel family protein [Candidatus Pullilachnospira stercoravium]